MSKPDYFQAAAPVIFLQLSRERCDAHQGFKAEDKDHPRVQIVAKPTLGLVKAQMGITDLPDATPAQGLRNAMKRMSMMIHSFSGDFGLYVIPFSMNWPSLNEDGAIEARSDMLENLSLDDFAKIQKAVNEVSGIQEIEEKNSKGESDQ